MQLPKFATTEKSFALLQTQWTTILNPIISLPFLNQNTLTKVALIAGSNSINHLLSRPLQGWFVIRQRAASAIYDDQDNNSSPQRTLLLVASAPVVVDLVVF